MRVIDTSCAGQETDGEVQNSMPWQNPYLRRMFIQGARAAVLRVKRRESTLGKWMNGLESRAANSLAATS